MILCDRHPLTDAGFLFGIKGVKEGVLTICTNLI